jgi:hypothetical protein
MAPEAGPQVRANPVLSEPRREVVKWLPLPPSEERRTLVGKLEPGTEGGTWCLRCELDRSITGSGGLVKLVANQPLSGCRTGLEVRVEGYVTTYGSETAFQVERMARVPPP